MNAKRLFRITLQMLTIIISTLAITNAQPTNFQPHGDNSSGATVASENIDSVTVGSTMRYFVMPDAVANPGYDFSTNPEALQSDFSWWTKESASLTDSGLVANIVYIKWDAIGADVLNVTEIGDNCNASDTTRIPVSVINEPTAAFNGSTSDDVCNSTPADVSYTFTVDLGTDVIDNNLQLAVQVNGPATSSIYTNTYNLTEGTVTFDIAAGNFDDGYGEYSIILTNVSDRISRKSGVTVDPSATFALTISPLPSTGKIYHLPNN